MKKEFKRNTYSDKVCQPMSMIPTSLCFGTRGFGVESTMSKIYIYIFQPPLTGPKDILHDFTVRYQDLSEYVSVSNS